MRRALTPVIILALSLAVFLTLFHPAVLDIGNAGWLIRGTDNGEGAVGLHAWLHDPASVTRPFTTLLNAPDGVSLLFTDSNPLVSTLVKPFAAWLPADAQFIGPWFLLSLILQVLFAWLLLRRHAPEPLALWAGVALLAFPPTLLNRYIHANLFPHWTILAALWLFLDPVRGTRLRWWGPLIVVTALIHSYLLVMVGALWASAMLMHFIRGARRLRWSLVGQGGIVLLLVAAIAWWLGVGGDYAPAGNYGFFSMPLDALWNPSNPTFSRFLPTFTQREGRDFEGFQYLGLGGLLLVVDALVIGLRGRLIAPRAERTVRQRLKWLAPALVVLTLLAISHRPDFAGHPMFRLPLPEAIVNSLDSVRASGRLFWPVGYVLILLSILTLYRMPRERTGFLLAACVGLQIADVASITKMVRATSAEAGAHRLYRLTADPRWDAVIGSAKSIAFLPGDVTVRLQLFQEIAWRANSRGIPVNSIYAARTSRASAERLERERVDFAAGRLVPGRLYVLLPTAPLPDAAIPHMLTLDNVTVITPR